MNYSVESKEEEFKNLTTKEVLDLIPVLFSEPHVSFNIYNEHGKNVTSKFYENSNSEWVHDKGE